MSRVIEFMGLPGAGKSTLARAWLREPRRTGALLLANEEAVIRCLRRRDDGLIRNLLKRFPHFVWEPVAGSRNALSELHAFSCAHPDLFALVFELVRAESVPRPVRQCILFAWYRHASERQLLEDRLRPGEAALVEEGLAMALLSLLDCLPSEATGTGEIDRFIRWMPAPSALVWIDTPPPECAARLRRRPEMPLPWQDCSDRELLDRLSRGRRGLEHAFAACERRGIPCLRIPNPEGDSAEAARVLSRTGRAWAEHLLAPR